MLCQECNERPATLHFTKVVNGEKTVIQLCERCAQEKGEIFLLDNTGGFSFNDLLAGIFKFDPTFQQMKSQPSPAKDIVQCDQCEMTFPEFMKVGRFGCSHCYESFQSQINPILRRLHSGNPTHGGKIPKRIGGSIHIKKKIKTLKEELKSLIDKEEFEKAADVRDQIRSLENNLLDGEGKNI